MAEGGREAATHWVADAPRPYEWMLADVGRAWKADPAGLRAFVATVRDPRVADALSTYWLNLSDPKEAVRRANASPAALDCRGVRGAEVVLN